MSKASNWTGWLLPAGALVVAILLIVVLQPQSAPSPSPSYEPVATLGYLEQHSVSTDTSVISFGLEGAEIVVRETIGGNVTILGGQPVRIEPGSTAGASPTVPGAVGIEMVCPLPGDAEGRRFIFGHLTSPKAFEFVGAPAVGRAASDGLFLYLLKPGPIPGTTTLFVQSGLERVGFRADSFDALKTVGSKQASGCFVGG